MCVLVFVASNTRRDFDGLAAGGGWPLVLDKCGDELAAPWLGLACLHCTASFEAVRAALASPPSPSTHTHAISCPCMTSAGVSPARSFNDPYSLYGLQHPRMHRLYLSTNVLLPHSGNWGLFIASHANASLGFLSKRYILLPLDVFSTQQLSLLVTAMPILLADPPFY